MAVATRGASCLHILFLLAVCASVCLASVRADVASAKALDVSATARAAGPGSLSKADMSSMDAEVTQKLDAMHKLLEGIHNGVGKSSRLRASAMREKFDKLTSIINGLRTQKDLLYSQNLKLKKEMGATVTKLELVERQLKAEALRANDNDYRLWLATKAGEITSFLNKNGLQTYTDKRFNPMMAGIVTYSIALIPLAMATIYLLKSAKSFSLLTVLMACNLFEIGYVCVSIASMVLLLTADPWHALWRISESVFVFLNVVLASIFWPSLLIIVTDLVRTPSAAVRRNLLPEFILRGIVAIDYGRKVWVATIEMNGEQPHTPPASYALYLVGTLVCRRLTSNALWHMQKESHPHTILPTRNDDAHQLDHAVTHALSPALETTSRNALDALVPASHTD
jgi:hypothetical protein